MSRSDSPPTDLGAHQETRRQAERVREARANAMRALLSQQEEIDGAVMREDWIRATALALAALRDPTLPLYFRGVYEAYLATFPGRERHTLGHYYRCLQAIDRLQEYADANPDAEIRQGTYDRIRDLHDCLARVEELMRAEDELRARLRQ